MPAMGSEEKRVAALYRVSTKAQLERATNDIPMQKIACKAFADAKPGWIIVKEYYERGVSGYKKRAEERDVLQQLKSDAEKGGFDILLVFMADRLGRREDETPFIMKWFSEKGIEIWSVKEGRQYADSRTDLLINFIKSWQSSGESEKTGIRVREKHTQMAAQGAFTGGAVPFGYDIVLSGQESKTGRRLNKMVVNENERKTVELIYHLNVIYGYGGRRIANHLNKQGIPTKNGCQWSGNAVNGILKNPVYKGFPAYGKTSQVTGRYERLSPEQWFMPADKVERLAIIDEKLWERSQAIRRARTTLNKAVPAAKDTNHAPRSTKSRLLLTGIATCGHCGGSYQQHIHMAKWRTKNGDVKHKTTYHYKCWKKASGKDCSGQTSYVISKIEGPVQVAIGTYLAGLEKRELPAPVLQLKQGLYNDSEDLLKEKNRRRLEKKGELETLYGEITKSLAGNSNFPPDILYEAIRLNQMETKNIEKEIGELTNAILQNRNTADTLSGAPIQITDWQKEWDTAPHEVQKMLVSELINQVKVYRERLVITFNIHRDDFLKGATKSV